MRWVCHRGSGTVKDKRKNLDDLPANAVVWSPYDHHREVRGFDDVSLFSGWIRSSGIKCPYYPERVLRQFGGMQTVPPPLTFEPPSYEEIDHMWLLYHLYRVIITQPAVNPTQTVPMYLAWYREHSHPLMVPLETRIIEQISASVSIVNA